LQIKHTHLDMKLLIQKDISCCQLCVDNRFWCIRMQKAHTKGKLQKNDIQTYFKNS